LKKCKHFALSGFKQIKKRINSKNMYNVAELTDPPTSVIESLVILFCVLCGIICPVCLTLFHWNLPVKNYQSKQFPFLSTFGSYMICGHFGLDSKWSLLLGIKWLV